MIDSFLYLSVSIYISLFVSAMFNKILLRQIY